MASVSLGYSTLDDEGGVRGGLSVKLPKVRTNPYHLFFDCAVTFLVAFCFFTVGTVSRGLAFGDDWIGMCAIGGATAACYMLAAVLTGGTTMPHVDILTVLLSLRMMGFKSLRKNVDPDSPPSGHYAPSIALNRDDGQFYYTLGMSTAFWLIVTIFAAGFASAGICRLVLDSAYDNAEITIRDANFNSGEAFFVEIFGVFFMNYLALQLPLNGVHPINTAILLGIVALGFQAFGFNVSSACFNFVRWLSVNAVGGASAWSNDAWVWPVAVVVGGAAIYVVQMVMTWALDHGNYWSSKKKNNQS